HNGEINTLQGNVTWMRAREAEWRGDDDRPPTNDQRPPTNDDDHPVSLSPCHLVTNDSHLVSLSPCQLVTDGAALAEHVARLGPIVDENGSDSAMLDNVLELLVLGGRDIRHALAMLVPEAWENVQDMNESWRAFYQYHAGLMEP